MKTRVFKCVGRGGKGSDMDYVASHYLGDGVGQMFGAECLTLSQFFF